MSEFSDWAAQVGISREWLDVPAIGAVSVLRRAASEVVVSGKRSAFARERVTPQDMWHIGSCTKAMTATVLARLVERGITDFDAALGDSLPGIAGKMHPGFVRLTLRDVLTHSAGAARDPQHSTFAALRRSTGPVESQRLFLATEALRERPRPGTGYSNLGYIVLGSVIEHLTGNTWEAALESEVMGPLGIARYGFGPPGEVGALDQPRGHRRVGGAWRVQTAARHGDNPRAYGPAGRVHIGLADWARFLRVHLHGGPPSYLRPSTLRALHQPAENGFAMGWRVVRDTETGETQLHHTGSNTAWFAQAMLLPQRGAGAGIVCNAYDAQVEGSMDRLARQLVAPARPDEDGPP